jgi:hypothetical protein
VKVKETTEFTHKTIQGRVHLSSDPKQLQVETQDFHLIPADDGLERVSIVGPDFSQQRLRLVGGNG